MKRYLLVHLVIFAPAIMLLVVYTKEVIAVDQCLDVGGSFNYLAGMCDLNASHPVLPFNERHSLLNMAGILSGIIGTAGIILSNRMKKHRGIIDKTKGKVI